MFKFWLFLHFTGVTVWIGSLVAFTLTLLMMKKHLGSKELSIILKKIIQIIHILIHPSAIFVLISGFFMMISVNFGEATKPFYFNFMNQFGGVTILFSIISISISGRKLVKQLNDLEKKGGVIKNIGGLNMFIMILLITIVLILTVSIVVIFKY